MQSPVGSKVYPPEGTVGDVFFLIDAGPVGPPLMLRIPLQALPGNSFSNYWVVKGSFLLGIQQGTVLFHEVGVELLNTIGAKAVAELGL